MSDCDAEAAAVGAKAAEKLALEGEITMLQMQINSKQGQLQVVNAELTQLIAEYNACLAQH